MEDFLRYSIYFAPRQGPLADFAARWLGWDPGEGRDVPQMTVQDLPAPVADITAAARKYGFHGTIKPPFRLRDDHIAAQLRERVAALASGLAPVTMDGLRLASLEGFLALVPLGDPTGLVNLARQVVMDLDDFRAGASAAELARRRAAGLTQRQDTLLLRWGYPYVMEEFRFHLTLTGKLDADLAETVQRYLVRTLAPVLPAPFRVEDLCLFGEDDQGRFHLIDRFALSG